jgi:hypothetical protein
LDKAYFDAKYKPFTRWDAMDTRERLRDPLCVPRLSDDVLRLLVADDIG